MDKVLSYIKERGGMVNANIQAGKVPTDEQLAKFTTETVGKLKEMVKDAPDAIKQKISTAWAPTWDYYKNCPGRTEAKLDPAKLLDILKRIKDRLVEAPESKGGGYAGGKGKGKARTGKGEGDAPAEEEAEKKPKQFNGPETIENIDIDSAHVGRIVGPKGATMKMIQEASECKIDINVNVVTITGPEDGMPIAVTAIKELCEKGFCGLAFGADFQEQGVNIHPIYFSELIGKEGKVIRAIKDTLKVELSIPKIPPNAKVREMKKKLKVGFAGRKPDVEKAKEVVNDIVMYGHHEITHPGLAHREVEVEAHQTRFIIGKGGSESRHIQNSYKVKMYIPNEHSENQKLLIVGEPESCDRAVKYVMNCVDAAEVQLKSGGRKEDGAEDFWGDEQHESWMDQYMYKRK
jgi:rRNA processing protein Krr1/Pno1